MFYLPLILFIGGCAPYTKALPNYYGGLEPLQILTLLQEREARFAGLSGSGDLYINLSGKAITGKALIRANRSGSFRVDILNPLFQPAFTLVYHKGLLSLLFVEEGKVYRQWVDLTDTIYISRVPVRPSFISAIIFGSPLLSGGVVKGGGFNGRLYELEIFSPKGFIYKLSVNPEGLSILSLETYDTSEMFIYAIDNRFASKGESDSPIIPSVIKGRYPGMEMSFTYDRVELLKEIEDKEFELALPSGIEVIYTDTFPYIVEP